MSTYNINLSGKVPSPVVNDYYRLKAGTEIFATLVWKSAGFYNEDTPGASDTVHDVDIASEIAAAAPNPKKNDIINITGVSYTLAAPTTRRIVHDATKFKCGIPPL